MNPLQLFAEHRTAILSAAGAGVVGLALFHRRKAGGDTGVAATSAAATIPAAGIAPAPSNETYDAYNALTGQLDQIRDQLRAANSVTTAPAPASSNLLNGYKPGLYRRSGTTQVFQLTADGKLDYLTRNEHMPLITKGVTVMPVSKDSDFWRRPYLDPVGTFKNWSSGLKPPGRSAG